MQNKLEEFNVEKLRYMIRDAATMVAVETHVLRYWEEELELTIPRNEMGHRYYTKENIEEFLKIKKLKEQGYQLKAIKALIHNQPIEMPKDNNAQVQAISNEKLVQFRELMNDIVGQAIELNNEELTCLIGDEVRNCVLKEMNYLMKEQDELQEERFKKLDEAIRGGIRRKSLFSKNSAIKDKRKKSKDIPAHA